jgi:hypothetical protein
MSIEPMCLTSILPRGSVSNSAATLWNVLMLMRPGSQASCRRAATLAVMPQTSYVRCRVLRPD